MRRIIMNTGTTVCKMANFMITPLRALSRNFRKGTFFRIKHAASIRAWVLRPALWVIDYCWVFYVTTGYKINPRNVTHGRSIQSGHGRTGFPKSGPIQFVQMFNFACCAFTTQISVPTQWIMSIPFWPNSFTRTAIYYIKALPRK